MSSSSAESIENFSNTSTLLHGNDSELIFFINPNEESFGIIVENTSARWPVSVQIACLEESVSFSIFNLKLKVRINFIIVKDIKIGSVANRVCTYLKRKWSLIN